MTTRAATGDTNADTAAVGGRSEPYLVGRPSVLAPLLLSSLRIPLLLLAYVLVSGALLLAGVAPTWSAAWQVAANHSYVVLNLLVDLPCLLVLAAVLRRDGRGLRDLLGPDGFRARRDLPRSLAVFAVMTIVFGGFPLLAQLITGSPPYPAGITTPPLWVVAWTIVAFPLLTAPTEEFLFRGYAVPVTS